MIDNTGNSTAVLFEMKVKQESWRALFSCTVSSRHKGAFRITAGGLQQQQYLLSKTTENTNPSKQPECPEKMHPVPQKMHLRVQWVQCERPLKGSLCLGDQRDACFGKKVSHGSQAPHDSYKTHPTRNATPLLVFILLLSFSAVSISLVSF